MPPEPTPPQGPEGKSRFPRPGSWGGAPKKEAPGEQPGWKVSPSADGRGAVPPKRRQFWRLWPFLLGLLVINYWVASTIPDKPERARIAYSPQFLEQVKKSNVSEVTITEQDVEGEFKKPVTIDKKSFTRFATNQPALPTDDTLLALLKDNKVEINAKSPDSGRGLLQQILLGFGPTLLILGIIIFAMRRATAGGGALGSLGRSKAKRYEGTERVTFEDVAGIEEAEQELVEVVDFLKNPSKYGALGGKIPRGVLLSGPPGTGKTLLARAVAGEAGVPFFSASASEFVEMIVGVGASRVRDLFAQAKAAQPAIVFIDELDAIGRARGGGANLGGHDEREQTLNQILTEMDGFSPNSGVIVLAATNRPDVLDKALLPPGPLRPPRLGAAARPAGSPRDPPGAHALGAALARGRSRLDRLDHARDGRRRSRESRQRGRAPGRPPGPQDRRDGRLHRRRREDPAGRRAARDDDAGRSRAHGLPRGRARARRHADPRGRPGAQGLDHPARHGPRSDVLVARHRSLQLRRGVPQGAPAGRAGRAGGRGDRLRQHHLGRRVRPPAGDRDRAPDGRPLGHEPARSGRWRCSPPTATARCSPASPRPPS